MSIRPTFWNCHSVDMINESLDILKTRPSNFGILSTNELDGLFTNGPAFTQFRNAVFSACCVCSACSKSSCFCCCCALSFAAAWVNAVSAYGCHRHGTQSRQNAWRCCRWWCLNRNIPCCCLREPWAVEELALVTSETELAVALSV